MAVWSWGAYLGEKVLNNGYEEGIVLDYLENVSEGSGENLFVVLNGKLITPNLASSVISEKTQLSNLQIRV
ncbi:aminotransferase class IV [Fusobacterium nucleatum]|uniref:aminotransferase class IV n=1 Tax=Fusobacterium nucleatum TaxID=851 RepID=UPI0030B87F07